MHFQDDGQLLFPVLSDVQSLRRGGLLNYDSPIAAYLHCDCKYSPNVSLVPETVSTLSNMETFAAAYDVWAVIAKGPLSYSADQLCIDGCKEYPNWDTMMKTVLHDLLDKYNFRGAFKSSLRWLRIFGEGIGHSFNSRDGDAGVVANILVDLPSIYSGGVINVTREGKTESFNFSKERGKEVHFLHWFHDTTVTMEEIISGHRVCLLYEVIVDPGVSYPLTLKMDSVPLRNLEAYVRSIVPQLIFRNEHPKKRYLPLARILIQTYGRIGLEPPPACIELCSRIVSSYERTIQDVMKSCAERDALSNMANLSNLRREGDEIVWSFGGRTHMARVFGPKYVRAFDKAVGGFSSTLRYTSC